MHEAGGGTSNTKAKDGFACGIKWEMERIAFCISPTFPLLLALLLNKTLLYNKGPLNNFFFFLNWQVDKYRLCHPGLQPLLRVWSYLIPALWISAQNMLHNLGLCLINMILDLEEKNKRHVSLWGLEEREPHNSS